MSSSTITFMVVFYAIIFIILIVGIRIQSKSKKETAEDRRRKKLEEKQRYIKMYADMSQNAILRSHVKELYNKITTLAVFDRETAQSEAARMCLKQIVVIISFSLGGFILYKQFINAILCVVFGCVIAKVMVQKKLDKIHLAVYKELRATISSLRQEYMRLGTVTDALSCAEYGNLLRGVFNEIYSMLISANVEERLQDFLERVPFRPVQTVARICYTTSNDGDSETNTGQSSFIQTLTLISSDVNGELIALNYQKNLFGFLEYLPLAPLIAMVPFEAYFVSIMPGTALIYHGPIGNMLKSFQILLCMVAYGVVASVNSVSSIKDDDRIRLVRRLLMRPSIRRFVYGMLPRGSKKNDIQRKINRAVSKQDLYHFYLFKTLCATVLFVVMLLSTIIGTYNGAKYVRESTSMLGLVATTEMEDYPKKDIQAMDNEYIKAEGEMPDDELTVLIKTYMPGLTELQMQDQKDRMEDKYNAIMNSYYKWYYALLVCGISVLGWFIPNISLRLRQSLAKSEAEEDFLQLQTLMTVLMYTNYDTLDVLEQMTEISRIHKDMLLYCYQSYPSNPDLELTRLENRTPIIEFKRFIGKLKLTANDISMVEAFSDLVIERDYIVTMRESARRSSINRKRGWCGKLALAPMMVMVVVELLYPLCYLGFTQFTSAIDSMQDQL